MNNNEIINKDEKLYQTQNQEPTHVLLVGMYSDTGLETQALESLSELKLLAQTSIGDGYENSNFYLLTQCRPNPDVSTYLGSGKAVEAGELCRDNDVSLVVVDGEMSPSQIKNLENEIKNPEERTISDEYVDFQLLFYL